MRGGNNKEEETRNAARQSIFGFQRRLRQEVIEVEGVMWSIKRHQHLHLPREWSSSLPSFPHDATAKKATMGRRKTKGKSNVVSEVSKCHLEKFKGWRGCPNRKEPNRNITKLNPPKQRSFVSRRSAIRRYLKHKLHIITFHSHSLSFFRGSPCWPFSNTDFRAHWTPFKPIQFCALHGFLQYLRRFHMNLFFD